jgi:MFS family permease
LIEDKARATEVLFMTTESISFVKKCQLLFSNKCFLYLTIASFFRFFGGYSLGFLSATFFEHEYPDNNT